MGFFSFLKPKSIIDTINDLSEESINHYKEIGITLESPNKVEIYLLTTVLSIKCLAEMEKVKFTLNEINLIITNIHRYIKSLKLDLDEQTIGIMFTERLDRFYEDYKNYILALKNSKNEFPYFTFQTIIDSPFQFYQVNNSNNNRNIDLVSGDALHMLTFIESYSAHASWLIRNLRKL